MKIRISQNLYLAALLCASVPPICAQGFVNLNFENALIVPDSSSPFLVNASNALAGWSGGPLYGIQNNEIPYNTVSLGSPAVSIHDTNDAGGMTPIQGRYSVYLQGQIGSVAIWQIGQVPNTAQSLTFWSYFTGFQVTFNGQPIPYIGIGSGANYTIYGGDISSLAGQTGELRFSGGGFLDNIQFSNQPIPEPSGFILFGVGALLLGFFRRRNSSP